MVMSIEIPVSTSPYPGLRPFQDSEADIFFGREEQTDQLLRKLQGSRFLAIVGPSGCGKSSLVRAGMIAALKAGFLADAGAQWRIVEMRPGEEPLERLARAFLLSRAVLHDHAVEPEAAAFAQATLRRGPLGLLEMLRERPLPANLNLLILVDQFEEIFRYRLEGNSDAADAFVALLLATATQQECPVYIAITMRSDFLGDCALFSGLPEAINDSQFLTPRLTRDQSDAAIVKPARVFGGKIDPSLVNTLLNDLRADPDQLPLLQHALMRMWVCAKQRSRISLEDYKAIGTLSEALSNHADEVYGSLTERQKHVAEIMFRRLTERGVGQRDTRRPARLGDIADVARVDAEEVAPVVEEFRKADRSFVMPPPGVLLKRETMLDIGHESLIRQWRRLNEWVDEEARSAAFYQRLKQTAVLWDRGDAALWGGIDLERAQVWKGEQVPTSEWASRYGSADELALALSFLGVSERLCTELRLREEEEAERRLKDQLERLGLEERANKAKKFKLFAGVLGVVVLLLAGIVMWALVQRNVATEQRLLATEKAREAEGQRQIAAQLRELALVAEDLAKEKADEAFKLKGFADQSAQNAIAQKRIAEKARDDARHAVGRLTYQTRVAEEARDSAHQALMERDRALAESEDQKRVAEQARDNAQQALIDRDKAATALTFEKHVAEAARDTAEQALEKLKAEQQKCASITAEQNSLLTSLGDVQPTRTHNLGTLKLQLTNVYGHALDDNIDIELRNQSSPSRSRSLKNISASKDIVIRDLAATPQGIYRLSIAPSSYLPVSKFVNLKPNATSEVSIALPINPVKVRRVTFPEYEGLRAEMQRLLEVSSNVEGFEGKTGKRLYDALDDIRKAGLLNIMVRSEAISLETGRSVLSGLEALLSIRGDRLFAAVNKTLAASVASSVAGGLFNRVDGSLHVPPPGFTPAYSFKTPDSYGSLQLTFFKNNDGKMIADVDIDDGAGLGHVFQVTRNSLTGRPMHPYDIHEILVFHQKIDPLYRLEP
jgi:hypothetical protein